MKGSWKFLRFEFFGGLKRIEVSNLKFGMKKLGFFGVECVFLLRPKFGPKKKMKKLGSSNQ